MGTYAMKRVAAGAHLPTPWLFDPAKRLDDRADYCLDCSFFPQWKHLVLVFTLGWSGARPMGEVYGQSESSNWPSKNVFPVTHRSIQTSPTQKHFEIWPFSKL